jgi:hypothetical protein
MPFSMQSAASRPKQRCCYGWRLLCPSYYDALGFELTKLKPEQAAYIGIPAEGPHKSYHYRYYGGSSAREGA